ncbi:small-conductance mechanosensitive channel [Chryseobacterium sp. SORGH_AS 447]|uniref:DUF5362 family protein n=1 Tax=Chryseobacterium sp. SORGH_AS_0447 TaxID=3041769 RepID=UPI0027823C58|nr:DUF5362 family protein [Chryseobacterium sp. SORGH_AS_0447]MDQ1161675.1 small-conductance mechanosensitive channel [Chryseobacterium sp. SORGH_AS_0447]
MEQSPFEQFEELRINAAAKSFLGEAAKWTTYLSILGYIGIGFMVLAAIVLFAVGSSISMGPMAGGIWMGVFYLALAAFYFIPINLLYKFSSNMKTALHSNDQASLVKAFEYLKSHYKFIGILTIVLIGIYILAVVGIVLTGMSGMR